MCGRVAPASCDGDFEMGLGLRLPRGPAFGVSVPCLVVEGSLEHGVDLLKDRALVLNVRMPAHPGSVVLAATGCAGCAIRWAVDLSVGGSLLFAVTL